MPDSPSPTGPFALAIPRERFEGLIREEIRAALPLDETRRIRRELMLLVASISSEEGGMLIGRSARNFRELCAANGVPVLALGHKTPRYRISAVAAALDKLAVATASQKAELEGKLIAITARLVREIEAIAA